MKVALNAKYRSQKITGVQRYAIEIVDRMEHCADLDMVRLAPSCGIGFPGASHMWEQAIFPLEARRRGAEVTLSLCNWAPVRGVRGVVVIHDHLTESLPTHYSPAYRRARQAFVKALRRSPLCVATVSQTSRMCLESLLDREVFVVAPGVDFNQPTCPSSVDAFLESKGLSRNHYVLLVGAHDPRKNLSFMEKLSPHLKDAGLQLVATYRAEARTFSEKIVASSANTKFIADPSDDDLAALYSGARATTQPSLGEGFGLPLLESLLMGTPFVSTNVGAATEVAQFGGEVLELQTDRWMEAIIDPPRNVDVDGVSKQYSWDSAARSISSLLLRQAP